MKQKYWSVRSRLLGEVKVETPFISVSKSIDSTELSSGLNHITVFNIQCPPLILAPLVNMSKGSCENKSALFILFIFHSKNSQISNLSLK